MRAYTARLEDHCTQKHDGKNDGFLKFGDIPPFSIYLNFEQFMKGHTTRLVEDPLKKEKKGKRGRPQDTSQIDAIIDLNENNLISSGTIKTQKERESSTIVKEEESIRTQSDHNRDMLRNCMK